MSIIFFNTYAYFTVFPPYIMIGKRFSSKSPFWYFEKSTTDYTTILDNYSLIYKLQSVVFSFIKTIWKRRGYLNKCMGVYCRFISFVANLYC